MGDRHGWMRVVRGETYVRFGECARTRVEMNAVEVRVLNELAVNVPSGNAAIKRFMRTDSWKRRMQPTGAKIREKRTFPRHASYGLKMVKTIAPSHTPKARRTNNGLRILEKSTLTVASWTNRSVKTARCAPIFKAMILIPISKRSTARTAMTL